MGLQYSAPLGDARLFASHNSKYPRRATSGRWHQGLLPKHVAAFARLGLGMGAAWTVVLGLALGLVCERFLEFRQKVWLIANISVVAQSLYKTK
jgi:hypothetical protein